MLLTVLDVLIEPNAAALVDGNSLVAPLENIELVLAEFFVCPRFQVNPSVKSGLSVGVRIPLRTVMAIPLHEQTRSRISRLFNATAALVNRTQILAEKNSMIVVARQRALGIAIMTMARIVIAIRTTARIESGIGAAETTATLGVVVETLHRHLCGSPQSLQGKSRRSQEAHGGCTRQEGCSRPQEKTPQILCECTQVDNDSQEVFNLGPLFRV